MKYTEKEKAILTREGAKPKQIIYSMTRNEYRKNLDAVIKRYIIESLEELDDGSFTETIEAIKNGNEEALKANLECTTAIHFKELNIVVNF